MMRLRFGPTSPYARKALMTAIECGLDGRIELVQAAPWAADSDVPRDNPLGKIPVLITEDGQHLFDSVVICEYLDSLHDGPRLFPAAGPTRWTVLRRHALCDGVMDAAVLRRLEEMFHEPAQASQSWLARQAAAMARGLDELEAEAATLDDEHFGIGHVALVCALGYMDLRFAGDDWRATRPGLAAWFERAMQRPSAARTVPPSA